MNDRHTRHPKPIFHPPQTDREIIVQAYDKMDKEIASFTMSYLAWFDMSYEARIAHAKAECGKLVHHVRWAYKEWRRYT
ncbi:MAG: hypothetical protein IH600_15045 [Bacteroidetes bacterium]|nr:hypothetical protein [Bacteroidota bacterium]